MTVKQHRITCHIRRDDEVNLTHCGQMTEADYPMIKDAPIAMATKSKGIALFDNMEQPNNTATASYTQCRACSADYFSECN